MIDLLSVATDGYLNRGTKKLLVIAVAGYLNFASPVTPDEGGGGKDISSVSQVDYRKIKHERILQEDKEILLMIKAIVDYELL
jgi:hypothetical protein